MIKKNLKNFFNLGLSVLIVSSLQFTALAKEFNAKVVKNHDGDTITVMLDGKKETVRLIGIDTPEIKQGYWGIEAQKFTEKLTKGKTVKLETDINERDVYKRLLAYVFVDGKFVNLALAEEGYAVLLTYPPNIKYVDKFTKAQKDARDAKKGIWSPKNGLKVTPHEFRHGVKPSGMNAITSTASKDKNMKVKVNIKTGIYHYPDSPYYNCKDCSLEITESDAIAKGYRKSKK